MKWSVPECVLSCFSHVDSVQPYGLQLTRLLCPCDSLGNNTVVGCYTVFQGIFLIQELNSHLLHLTCIGRQVLYH